MAVIKAGNSKAPINRAVNYVRRSDKTGEGLLSGIHCEPDTALYEMMATKALYNKTGGRTYKHFIQSFAPEETIMPATAHEIARNLAEQVPAWKGYEVLIATHVDRPHIHSHFIVNSVSFEDGRKLRWMKKDLEEMKKSSDALCRQYGLSVTEKGITFAGTIRTDGTAYEKNTYRILEKAAKGETESFIQELALAVMDYREKAVSKEDFIQLMKEKGYGVTWTGERQYITFTDLSREAAGKKKCRIRDKKLEEYYHVPFGKEVFLNEFAANARRKEERSAYEGRRRTGSRSQKAGSASGRERTVQSPGDQNEGKRTRGSR